MAKFTCFFGRRSGLRAFVFNGMRWPQSSSVTLTFDLKGLTIRDPLSDRFNFMGRQATSGLTLWPPYMSRKSGCETRLCHHLSGYLWEMSAWAGNISFRYTQGNAGRSASSTCIRGVPVNFCQISLTCSPEFCKWTLLHRRRGEFISKLLGVRQRPV